MYKLYIYIYIYIVYVYFDDVIIKHYSDKIHKSKDSTSKYITERSKNIQDKTVEVIYKYIDINNICIYCKIFVSSPVCL